MSSRGTPSAPSSLLRPHSTIDMDELNNFIQNIRMATEDGRSDYLAINILDVVKCWVELARVKVKRCHQDGHEYQVVINKVQSSHWLHVSMTRPLVYSTNVVVTFHTECEAARTMLTRTCVEIKDMRRIYHDHFPLSGRGGYTPTHNDFDRGLLAAMRAMEHAWDGING